MSECRTCCGYDIEIPSDLSAGLVLYATQGYSFVITSCPIGMVCQPGLLPITVTIDPGRIPPVIIPTLIIGTGGTITLQGCESLISQTVPPSATQALLQNLAATMQQEWSRQQANCDVKAQFPTPPFKKRVDVFNTLQCFDAFCPGGTLGGHACTPPRTFSVTLFDPSDAVIAQQQDAMNALALAKAQTDAQNIAGPVCGVCNSFFHAFATCPANPGIAADYDVAAGTFCKPLGTAQSVVDSEAQMFAFNQVEAALLTAGCVCTASVNTTTRAVTTTCALGFQLVDMNGHLIPPPNFFVVNGTLDFDAMYFALTGNHLHGPIIVVPSFSAPSFIIVYP